jgi:UDP-N-acetylglucosamine acyltransferase
VIHPTAIVDPGARLAEGVEVGAYSVVGSDVEVGAGTRIGPHVVLQGPTRIGRENVIFQFCSVGEAPQDKKYAGEPTRLEIGDRNTIREFCTINRGTVQDVGATRIGDDNWIMAYVHVAHDCQVGSNTIFANCASLAGHCHIGDHAILGGFTLVHQFCRVGSHAITAIGTATLKDIPPYVKASGNFAAPHGLNVEGMRRHGLSNDAIAAVRQAYKVVYRQGLTLEQAKAALAEPARESPEVARFLEFINSSRRGIVR